jgi:hypothetical protein
VRRTIVFHNKKQLNFTTFTLNAKMLIGLPGLLSKSQKLTALVSDRGNKQQLATVTSAGHMILLTY